LPGTVVICGARTVKGQNRLAFMMYTVVYHFGPLWSLPSKVAMPPDSVSDLFYYLPTMIGRRNGRRPAQVFG
jgi:hypothetical protein